MPRKWKWTDRFLPRESQLAGKFNFSTADIDVIVEKVGLPLPTTLYETGFFIEPEVSATTEPTEKVPAEDDRREKVDRREGLRRRLEAAANGLAEDRWVDSKKLLPSEIEPLVQAIIDASENLLEKLRAGSGGVNRPISSAVHYAFRGQSRDKLIRSVKAVRWLKNAAMDARSLAHDEKDIVPRHATDTALRAFIQHLISIYHEFWEKPSSPATGAAEQRTRPPTRPWLSRHAILFAQAVLSQLRIPLSPDGIRENARPPRKRPPRVGGLAAQ